MLIFPILFNPTIERIVCQCLTIIRIYASMNNKREGRVMISNKSQSDFLIRSKDLNRMLEGRFTDRTPIDKIEKFLDENKFEYYNIRDKKTPCGEFKYKLTREQVLSQSRLYENFAIYESLADADQHLTLQGEIEIESNFIMKASLSTAPGIPNRVAMQNPEYNIYNYDLKERREPDIPGLQNVIDYICKHELIDMVVEFTLYPTYVGVHKENIIIWELRNY